MKVVVYGWVGMRSKREERNYLEFWNFRVDLGIVEMEERRMLFIEVGRMVSKKEEMRFGEMGE